MYFHQNKVFSEYTHIQQRCPILLMSPHSGRDYEHYFLNQTNLSINCLRLSEDHYIDVLWKPVLDLGVNMISATFPRIYVDVNRSPLDIDPIMWEGGPKNLFNNGSMKVRSGIGVFPKVNLNGLELYNSKISFNEARYRLFNYYFPYHKKIKESIYKNFQTYKKLIVIDCHSMPPFSCEEGVDIVLSNVLGKSAEMGVLRLISSEFEKYNFKVSINKPFQGGFITSYYGNPKNNLHAVQIEINKDLYINDESMYICENKSYKLIKCLKRIIINLKNNF